jgi:hypothetical protein
MYRTMGVSLKVPELVELRLQVLPGRSWNENIDARAPPLLGRDLSMLQIRIYVIATRCEEAPKIRMVSISVESYGACPVGRPMQHEVFPRGENKASNPATA